MVGLAPSRDAEICLGGDLGSFLIEVGPFHNYCLPDGVQKNSLV